MSNLTAKAAPEFLKDSVIYQINLRTFTPDGTLRAAERLLPHIAALGADMVYLCPVTLADDDPRPEFWSDRQKQSGLNNPKNIYRVGDYYAVDPEYGTDDDLKSFVRTAHGLGLRVLLDLVYYHCGPSAAFLAEHPDFAVRDENGEIRNGHWHFPELNFASSGLREYLWRNMEYFVREFDVDGYRCDVAGAVPLDFWEEGRRRIDALKPGLLMLAESEGNRREEQRAAFELNYGMTFIWSFPAVLRGEKPASALREAREQRRAEALPGATTTILRTTSMTTGSRNSAPSGSKPPSPSALRLTVCRCSTAGRRSPTRTATASSGTVFTAPGSSSTGRTRSRRPANAA